MYFHPLFINWENKHIVFIGGGVIAERKIISLLKTKANITIYSPTITGRLQGLVSEDKIHWVNAYYEPDQCKDAFFLIAATNDKKTNHHIIEDCLQMNVPLTLNVSEHQKGNAIMPAILTNDSFQIAISSNGKSPKATKALKEKIARMLST